MSVFRWSHFYYIKWTSVLFFILRTLGVYELLQVARHLWNEYVCIRSLRVLSESLAPCIILYCT